MGIVEDLSRQLAPHTNKLATTISAHAGRIENRISDLNRPDTADIYLRLIRNNKLSVAESLGGPKQGEFWLIQAIVSNGATGFTLRTNTGALIAAIEKGKTFNSSPGGDLAILPGEFLEFTPEAEGVFDFTVTIVRRKIPGAVPDAGHGVSQEDYTPHNEHETDRDIVHAYDVAAMSHAE